MPGVSFVAQSRQQIAPCVVGEARTFDLPAGAVCEGEYELTLGTGTFTVEVHASGFQTKTLDITLPKPANCCGPAPIERRTLTLPR